MEFLFECLTVEFTRIGRDSEIDYPQKRDKMKQEPGYCLRRNFY